VSRFVNVDAGQRCTYDSLKLLLHTHTYDKANLD